jgi:HlyD family secretion protein
MRRRLIIIALALVLAAGAAWWWFAQTPAAGPLVLTGNVEVRQVNLGFKVGGRIKQLKVDEGDSIAEGQSLAALEKVYFEDSIAQLRAQRDQAAANVAKLEAGNRAGGNRASRSHRGRAGSVGDEFASHAGTSGTAAQECDGNAQGL